MCGIITTVTIFSYTFEISKKFRRCEPPSYYKEDIMKITLTFETTEMSMEFRRELAKITDRNKLLSELAEDEDWEVRYAVAGNPNISAKTLSELAKDNIWNVRCAVARNSNTSTETLSELAKDNHEDIATSAKNNPNFKK